MRQVGVVARMLAVRGARLLSAAAGRAGAAAQVASTVGKPIECLAAVAWAPRKEYWQDALSVEKVVVQPPKKGEVRVKITHAGTWVSGTRCGFRLGWVGQSSCTARARAERASNCSLSLQQS